MTVIVISARRPLRLGIIGVIAGLPRRDYQRQGKFIREGRRIKRDNLISLLCACFPRGVWQRPPAVSISEVDIDNFIRAGGAIFTAIMTLITSWALHPTCWSTCWSPGASAAASTCATPFTSVFPDLPLKFSYIGNSSLARLCHADLRGRRGNWKTSQKHDISGALHPAGYGRFCSLAFCHTQTGHYSVRSDEVT